jgi:KaiC/GvpD/RAD55 family RecA-like ATPase
MEAKPPPPHLFTRGLNRAVALAMNELPRDGEPPTLQNVTKHLLSTCNGQSALPPDWIATITEWIEWPFFEPEPFLDKLKAHYLFDQASALLDKAAQLPLEEYLAAIASLGKMAEELNRKPGNTFSFQWADAIQAAPTCAEIVEGIIPEAALGVVYGEPGCGKSFWAMDVAAAVATGKPFAGVHATEPGAVFYCAMEGSRGARNRVAALRQSGRLPDTAPLAMLFRPVNLLTPGEPEALIAAIKAAVAERGETPRLVVLDTLARAMAGGDENSGQDMGEAVKAADAIKDATGATVILVHHSGKDTNKGGRGHSSLRGAADCEIELTRPQGAAVTTVTCRKQKDAEPFPPMAFSLQSVVVGYDAKRGKEITSCVIQHEDPIIAAPGKSGRPKGPGCVDLIELLPQPTTAAWEMVAKEETGISKTTFHERKKEIQAAGMAKREGGNSGPWIAT